VSHGRRRRAEATRSGFGSGMTAALTLEDKLAAQRQIKALEAQRNQKRRSLFEAQDRIDAQRDAMIANIEGRLQQSVSLTQLFLLQWQLD
jgi:adenine-specific DNA-methyltransferase